MSEHNIEQLFSCDVVAKDGKKIGSVGQVYLDNETSQPSWITVKTGLFGLKETFVPLHNAVVTDTEIQLPYDDEKIKEAPRVDPDKHLDAAEEAELYHYYDIDAIIDSSVDDAKDDSNDDANDDAAQLPVEPAVAQAEETVVAIDEDQAVVEASPVDDQLVESELESTEEVSAEAINSELGAEEHLVEEDTDQLSELSANPEAVADLYEDPDNQH